MKKITASEFDAAFDRGEDVSGFLDESTSRRINKDLKRVNIDFPLWVVESLDKEAHRLGVTRQSLVKMWIAERLKGEKLVS
jgi:hypothetical protein